MGYKLNGKDLGIGVPFQDSEGTNYPANWLRVSTESERAAVPTGGITWVNDPVPVDTDFYWRSDLPKDIADLKKVWVQNQKTEANLLLADTDWLITRKAEIGTAVPSDITTYRAAVRTKCGEREATINACADTAKLAKTIRGDLPPTIAGTGSNGATEKKKEDGSSYDPVQYNDIANPDLLEDWPTKPS